MRALVLAAGEGTRLRPLTLDRPKPMLPVGGRPLLEHIVRLLRRHGVRQIALNLHYQPQAIVDFFGDGAPWDVEITYSPEDPILGTAGAVKRLEAFLNDTFLVYYGDVLTDLDLSALVRFHRQTGALATIALYRVSDPGARSVVEVGAEGRIRRFVEKPRAEEIFGNLANAGVYVLEPAVHRFIPADAFYDFGQDLFPQLLAEGLPLVGCPATGYVIDIGSPENYRQADADLRAGKLKLPD